MPDLGVLLFLVVLVAIAFYYRRRWLIRHDQHLYRKARWFADHRSKNNVTEVLEKMSYVGIRGRDVVLATSIRARIPDDDPEWESKFHQAMADARVAVAARNSELNTRGTR